MTLVAHATGNANVRAVISGLHAAGLLAEFHTSIATFPHSIWARCAQFWWGREFHRRAFDARLQPATIQHPFRELGRMGATRLNLKQLTKHETGWFSVDAVFRALDRDIARRLAAACLGKLGTVYAYEDGALATFQAAKQRGIKCCYDLPIAYWQTAQTLLAQEAERLPEWEPTLGGRRDSAAKLERKAAELALADAVFCPSDFVANSLPAWVHQDKRVSVLPFGSPPGHSRPHSPQTASRPLRVLFAGSLTQRKGLADLCAAMALLKRQDVELVVMGSLQSPLDFYRQHLSKFTYEPPRPHAQVLELMRSCDVFCLPSIVEGRALVMQEAMSQGLPLIITPNTGGSDLIVEGETGFLVQIRRPDLIAEKIAWFADHREALPEMAKASQRKAAQYTWEAYGAAVARAVQSL